MTAGATIPGGFDPRFLEAVLPTLTISIIGWFVLVAATGWLAGRRNWDDGLWALLALLTGPVAFVIVLLAPKALSPATPFEGATFREAAAAPDWPVFPAREARMASRQRTISTLVAALLGAMGAAAQVTDEVRLYAAVIIGAGGIAAAVVARWLAPSLVNASNLWRFWVALSTATLALSIAAVLTVAVVGAAGVLQRSVELVALPFYMAAAAFSPFVSALFEPAPFLIAIAVAGFWVVLTSALAARAPGAPPLRAT